MENVQKNWKVTRENSERETVKRERMIDRESKREMKKVHKNRKVRREREKITKEQRLKKVQNFYL